MLKPGGLVAAAVISRYASTIDGLRGLLEQDGFEASIERDLEDGRHTNPDQRPRWFATAYFHLPEEVPGELEDPERRARLLRALERVERAPSLLGASAHLMAIGTRR